MDPHELFARSRKIAICASIAALVALSGNAAAQSASGDHYPARPIRLIVPFAAGSSTDITVRRLEPHMSKTLGQKLIVENRPGAVGIIGAELVKRSAPDGYTVMFTAVSSQSIAAALRPKTLPYDVNKDFTPIGRAFTTTNIVAVNPSVPASSLQELIAYSKKVPGGLSFGSGGTGSSNHLAGEALRLNGANIVHVSYSNVSQAITDVIAGHIPMMIYTVALMPHVKAGQLRALAVTSEKRLAQASDIPTTVEQGIPDVVAQGWSGMFGPAGLATSMRDRLYGALRDAMDDPEIKKAYVLAGQEEGLLGPAAFQAFLEKDARMWRDIVTRAKLPTDQGAF